MKFYLTFLFTFLFSTHQLSAQEINLPFLVIQDSKIEESLGEVTDFLGSKKNGKSFPICKVVFTGSANDMKFSVQAIDNSWSNLFKYDEVCYGYVVVKNRMYVIFSPQDNIIDFKDLMYSSEDFKLFSKAQKPPTWHRGVPMWYYEKDNTPI